MLITALAPELLNQCLGHLSQEDLTKTSLVCRKWLAPSRDLYWNRLQVTLQDESAELLAPAVGEGTTFPPKIRGIRIDESEYFEYREGEETATWQTNLVKILNHFSNISSLTIGCLDLSKFPAERRPEVLRPGQAHQALIVQWLEVEHAPEGASFILNQPNIDFLGIGNIVVAKKADDKDKQDANDDADEKKNENENKTESDSVDMETLQQAPEYTVQLNKLRHLCIFSGSKGITWSRVVPELTKADLKELKTLVANCHDRYAFARLFDAASSTLRSVGIGFHGPGIDIDVSKAQSLSFLSFNLSLYPGKENILADVATTLSSAPPSLEHLFLNVGPDTLDAKKQLDGSTGQWAAIDEAIASVPGLRRVTVLMVIDSCIAMFVGMGSGLGNVVEQWTAEALETMKTRLPACDAKGIIEVKNIFGSWTSGAFGGYKTPE